MKIPIALVLIPCLLSGCDADPQTSTSPSGAFFGQSSPGTSSVPLTVPALASRPDHYVRAVTFSPDGTEAYWPVINSEDDFRRWIVGAWMDKGEWTQPGIAPFSDTRFYDDVPCLAPDGQELFFLSGRPLEAGGAIDRVRIWRVKRDGHIWSAPVPLPQVVNDGYSIHQQISLDREDNLYFGAEADAGFGSLDIYRSARIDGEFQAPVNLGPQINSAEADYAPSMFPDGNTLLFTRNMDDRWSLFVSFRTPNDSWTSPIDLMPHLAGVVGMSLGNSYVTADGKTLFFFGERVETCTPYWVDAAVLDPLRAAALRDQRH